MRLALVALAVFGLNLPFGYWRTGTQQRPPRPSASMLEKATSSADVPVSSTAIVTWMMRGPADAPSELLFVIWRGQPGWYHGLPRSSSGGVSGTSFTASATYGPVRIDFEFDGSGRVAKVQGQRVEMGTANVILVDAVDRPDVTRIVKMLRVERDGDRQRGPAGPVRALAASTEILDFIGCATRGGAVAVGFCRLVTGDGEKDRCTD